MSHDHAYRIAVEQISWKRWVVVTCDFDDCNYRWVAGRAKRRNLRQLWRDLNERVTSE